VPGCPPPPESLLNGLLLLQDQIAHFKNTGRKAPPNEKVD
jgi:NADH:ubiquinone oxidoreductase subunit B-like Fe-S oxidoreductase